MIFGIMSNQTLDNSVTDFQFRLLNHVSHPDPSDFPSPSIFFTGEYTEDPLKISEKFVVAPWRLILVLF